jgi:hypothetical protein
MAWNSNEERERKVWYLAECRYPVPKRKNQVNQIASRDHYADCLRDLSDHDLEIIWKSRIDLEQIQKLKRERKPTQGNEC